MEKECVFFFASKYFIGLVSFPDFLQKPGTAGNMTAEYCVLTWKLLLECSHSQRLVS